MSSSISVWSLARKLTRRSAAEDDRFGMEQDFVFAELPDEFLDAELVEEDFLFDRLVALVGEADFEPGLRKASSRRRPASLANWKSMVEKMVKSGRKVIFVPVCFGFLVSPMTVSFCVVTPALERHVVDLPVAGNVRALNQSEMALTHFAPTPWRPPEYL